MKYLHLLCPGSSWICKSHLPLNVCSSQKSRHPRETHTKLSRLYFITQTYSLITFCSEIPNNSMNLNQWLYVQLTWSRPTTAAETDKQKCFADRHTRKQFKFHISLRCQHFITISHCVQEKQLQAYANWKGSATNKQDNPR